MAYTSKNNNIRKILQSLKQASFIITVCMARSGEACKLTQMISDDLAPLTWKQYFVMPWADSHEQELKYGNLMSSLHSLSLTPETTCLLSTIALFSTCDIPQILLNVPVDDLRHQQYQLSLLVKKLKLWQNLATVTQK